jgi:ribonuclease R
VFPAGGAWKEAERARKGVTKRGPRGPARAALVTIDGEDARDFDDAVWAEKDGDGWRWRSSPSPMSRIT